MRLRTALAVALAVAAPRALAWGADGHAIVAEIADRRVGAHARAEIARLLGRGHSLAAEATWADDVRAERGDTFHWHFVDIPLDAAAYDPARDCRASTRGDCIVAALERARRALRCGDRDARREALRWTVHLVADLHQPLHTVGDEQGGNGIVTVVAMHGLRCGPRCAADPAAQNLHAIWDTSLIAATAWSWGAYVARLERGWLAGAEARDARHGDVLQWIGETHAVAREIWSWTPDDRVIGDDYYRRALPVLDRQLGRAGVRLAAFLDDALAARSCAAGPRARRRR